jgi:hypothetical protein
MFISKKRLEAMENRLEELEKALTALQSGPKVMRSLRKQKMLAEQSAKASVKQYFDAVELAE